MRYTSNSSNPNLKFSCQTFLDRLKLQLHDAIYRLQFYSNSLTHMLSLSNSHKDVASIQKNRDDKSHRVIVALVLHLVDNCLDNKLSISCKSLPCFAIIDEVV